MCLFRMEKNKNLKLLTDPSKVAHLESLCSNPYILILHLAIYGVPLVFNSVGKSRALTHFTFPARLSAHSALRCSTSEKPQTVSLHDEWASSYCVPTENSLPTTEYGFFVFFLFM